MVPGIGIQRGQALESAIKLRVGFEQQLLRNHVINVAGVGHVGRVESRARGTPWARQCRSRGEKALERIGHIRVEIVRYPRRVVVGVWGGRVDGGIVSCLYELVPNRRRNKVSITGGNPPGSRPR